MPAKKKSPAINLLPQEEFDRSPLGRTLKWATSTFRTIVIITELVVMAAFLSRFWLDAKNADLNDLITQNRAIIDSHQNLEKEVRLTQQKIKVFSALTKETGSAPLVTKIANLLPEGTRLISVSKVEDSLQIKGVSSNEKEVVQYITNLSSDPSFKEIKVN